MPKVPREAPAGTLAVGVCRCVHGQIDPLARASTRGRSLPSRSVDELARHWDDVHSTTADDEVSWFRAEPTSSLRLLEAWAPKRRALVDVGAGSSPLVDRLLLAGWRDVTVLDVSQAALDKVRRRRSGHDDAVTYLCADAGSWRPRRTYATWHDRAVFHFLVEPDRRAHYVEAASNAIPPGGVVVLATFAPDGPNRCSGLPTSRYDADELAACFASSFDLVHTEREEHVTPFGTIQPFTWAVLRHR